MMLNIESDALRKIINPLFFFCLFVLICISFKINAASYSKMTSFNSRIYCYIFLFSIPLGAVFVFINKDQINKIIEKDTAVFREERKKSSEYKINHPGLNRIPGIRFLSEKLYSQGWGFSCVLILIIFAAGFYLSFNLGGMDLYVDEFQVAGTAEGYLKTGTFYQWDYLINQISDTLYDRAWPHSWMVAQSYKIFGISEWSSRIVSVVFGIFFFISFYFIATFFTHNKYIAILSVSCLLLQPELTRLFRYTRMYAVFIPIFCLLYYCAFRCITENNTSSSKWMHPLIRNNLNFHYLFFLPALVLLVFNYLIHINSLVILPIIFLFSIGLSVYLKETKYFIIAAVGSIVLLILLAMADSYFSLYFDKVLSFFRSTNFEYLSYLTAYPFYAPASVTLLTSGFLFVFLATEKQTKIKMMYLFLTVIFSLVFFIFIANRYAAPKYISHIIPISVMLVVYFLFLFSRVSGKKWLTGIFTLLLIGSALMHSSIFFKKHFGNQHLLFGNPSIAYQTLIDQYDPEKEVIFGQFIRGFYLRELGNNIRFVNMLTNKKYAFKTFWEDINKYSAGWIVFETHKHQHIDLPILKYIDTSFRKIHGAGVDDTNIQIYYFNKQIIDQSIRDYQSRYRAK